MSDAQNTLAHRLKTRRKELGLSQCRLAIDGKTIVTHIMDAESGLTDLEGKDHQIAVALRCHPRWLVTGKGDRELPPEIAQALPKIHTSKQADDELAPDNSSGSNGIQVQEAIATLGQHIQQASDNTRQKLGALLNRLIREPEQNDRLGALANSLLLEDKRR